MRITDLNLSKDSGVLRAEAQIIWEDIERPPFQLFIETDEQHEDLFGLDPNAFLILCVVPAWEMREKRIKIDGTLCPVLCENVRAAITVLSSWFYKVGSHHPKACRPIEVVPGDGFTCKPPSQSKSMALLSCGIDSLATFRWHQLNLPADHPANIHAVLAVEFGDEPARAENPRLVPAINVAKEAGIEAFGVRTNLRNLIDDGYVYSDKWHGSALTGLASFFSQGFGQTYIASSSYATDLYPWGSHPLLDKYFSSAHFRVEHHGLQLSRLDKAALVGDWPVGLQNIRVCNNDSSGGSNCGTCFKCIVTMTALVALGKLDGCNSFPGVVSPELLQTMVQYEMIEEDNQVDWFCEMIPLLRDQGRTDLVAALETILFS